MTTQNRQKSNAKKTLKKHHFDKVYFSILERLVVQLLNTNILYIVLKISSPDGRFIYYSLIPSNKMPLQFFTYTSALMQHLMGLFCA